MQGWGGAGPAHQHACQPLLSPSMCPLLPCCCQAPGLQGPLQPAEQSLQVPTLQVSPPGGAGAGARPCCASRWPGAPGALGDQVEGQGRGSSRNERRPERARLRPWLRRAPGRVAAELTPAASRWPRLGLRERWPQSCGPLRVFWGEGPGPGWGIPATATGPGRHGRGEALGHLERKGQRR